VPTGRTPAPATHRAWRLSDPQIGWELLVEGCFGDCWKAVGQRHRQVLINLHNKCDPVLFKGPAAVEKLLARWRIQK
jgi:hypothetical protein